MQRLPHQREATVTFQQREILTNNERGEIVDEDGNLEFYYTAYRKMMKIYINEHFQKQWW